MHITNEIARHILDGAKHRSALWAGLNWKHPDIEEFITIKNWTTQIRALKEQNFDFPAPLDKTNISVGLDDIFFKQIRAGDKGVIDLYYRICKSMCKTGEPGFSVNVNSKSTEILRNACTEITSDKSGDVCNLGSINLARIKDLNELEEVTSLAVHFLYMGTFIGWLAHPDYEIIRSKYRRIGLGLMGVHEWCLRNNERYGPSGKLAQWLTHWKETSEYTAETLANLVYGDVCPIAVRSIAPNGTISIIGETTSGIEPIFCVAYKRRFLGPEGKWQFSYVIDPTAQRLVQEGIPPDQIEDSYQLAQNVERRIAMQAFIQDYVDQGISSTINIPSWGEFGNNNSVQFANILLQYLPKLRGITVYPDGARSGQPITPIPYEEAVKDAGVIYDENESNCIGGICGL